MSQDRISPMARDGARKNQVLKLCMTGAIGLVGCGIADRAGAVGGAPQGAAVIAQAMKEPIFKQALAAAASGQHTYSVLLPGSTDEDLPARLDTLALSARLAGWRLQEVVPLQREGSTRQLLLVFVLEPRP